APVDLVKRHGDVAYLRDTGVHPEYRRLGIGRVLYAARMKLARAAGAVWYIGATAPENEPIHRINERAGATRQPNVVPNFFPDGSDAVIYVGPLQSNPNS